MTKDTENKQNTVQEEGEVKVEEINSTSVASISVSEELNADLINQLVNYTIYKSKTGTRKQKTRAEVSGGGKKPWKQKHTGRARFGSTRNPIWRKGGVTFAARPGKAKIKINKKMYKKGMRMILSELNKEKVINLVNDFTLPEISTKEFIKKLEGIKMQGKKLIVLENIDQNTYLSARNYKYANVMEVNNIDALDLLYADSILFSKEAYASLSKSLEIA